MDLLHTNMFYQCLVDFLLNLIIDLFFPDPEAHIINNIIFGFIFINVLIKVDHFFIRFEQLVYFKHVFIVFVTPFRRINLLPLAYHFHRL